MSDAAWQHACDLQRLREAGRLSVKLGSKQIALFQVGAEVHACNNRCPHEGYPLVAGDLGSDCVLTCHWHNWKFDLRSGANRYGGDALRIYPVRIEADAVWVDLREPPAAERIAQLQRDLDAAMAEHDHPRIAREAARLGRLGVSAEALVTHALQLGHTRLRYGMTHAFAAAEVWLRLHDRQTEAAARLTCVIEALGHIAYDSLREAEYPFASRGLAWDEAAFLAAFEAQDEARAVGHLHGAFEQGLGVPELEPALGRAALAHYNDFGHSLIYLGHVRDLAARLGPQAVRPLLLAWLRALIFATREDLLPDFNAYAGALSAWPDAVGAARSMPSIEAFVAQPIKRTLQLALDGAAAHAPLAVQQALLGAAAEHLLRFDTQHEQRSDNPVADNVGWLDCTHAITFARAVRRHCSRFPELWPQGLLQLALFVGRNSAYLDAASDERWNVGDVQAFDSACEAQLLDHGLQPYILSVHLLKTWDAMREEIAAGAPADVQARLRAAVNRLFHARLKQKHSLRVARQALNFVQHEG